MSRPRPRIDLAGRRFGRLVALADVGRYFTKARLWRAQCDCGRTVEIASTYLLGGTRSCGCLLRESRNQTHGKYGTPAHQSWKAMLNRCRNPNSPDYPTYGGRGIKVCDRWYTFENFLADMGERPEGRTLDRIDGTGNYEPGNCRWATPAEQTRNSRAAKLDMVAADQIRWLCSDGGYSKTTVAKAFGVSEPAVYLVVKGKNWRAA